MDHNYTIYSNYNGRSSATTDELGFDQFLDMFSIFRMLEDP